MTTASTAQPLCPDRALREGHVLGQSSLALTACMTLVSPSAWLRGAIGTYRHRTELSLSLSLSLQWLPCQAPGVIRLVLGLVGPVSVYCDRVRWKV